MKVNAVPRPHRSAAVVGANGFLGSTLRQKLRQRGTPVHSYTRLAPCIDSNGVASPDLATADTIFWLASSIRPATLSAAPASSAADSDLAALTALLKALRSGGTAIRQRIVVVSSGGTVYDTSDPAPHSEGANLAPVNEYGSAMLAVEAAVRHHAPDAVVLRVSNAYGPGQPARRGQGVIAYWFDAISRGEPIAVLGRDDVARDYIYVDDVAEALLRVHEHPAPPVVMNIGSGTPTSLRQLVDLVRSTVAPVPIEVLHSSGRSFDAPSTWLDTSLAQQALGWAPTYDLESGLQETWKYVCAQRES